MIKVFDGTTLLSIARSLSNCLELPPKQLLGEIKLYIIRKMPKLELGYFPLHDFLEHCKTRNISIDVSIIQFDKVIFFHKTSIIDNGAFLREKGLLDLNEMLLKFSPLSEYLRSKGVEFFTEDNTIFISINGIPQQLKDIDSIKTKSSKRRIVERLTKRKTIKLEGITGYLFLSDLKNDAAYDRITYASEFLNDLDDCIDGVVAEWRKNSTPTILKCEVDIEFWYRDGDAYEQDNKFEKSYEIAKEGFLCLAEAFAKKYRPGVGFRSHSYYPFITHGVGLSPTNIKEFIE